MSLRWLSCLKKWESRYSSAEEYKVDASSLSSFRAPYELVKTMRASFSLGSAPNEVWEGGSFITRWMRDRSKAVNLHIKGLEAMGAKIRVESGYVKARAPQGLKGAEIFLEIASVGATENLIMAAVLAEGKTVIHNAAEEPEITDLINFLMKMGAKISGAGTSVVEIEGVRSLRSISHR